MQLSLIVFAVSALSTVAALPTNADQKHAVVNTRFVTYANGLQGRDADQTPKAVVNTRFVTYENGLQEREAATNDIEDELQERAAAGDSKAVVNTRFVTYENGLQE